MLSSLCLSWALTAVFVLVGVFALARLAVLASDAPGTDGCDRLAELSHVLMSVAMVAMVWGWPDGPTSPGGVVTLGVFGVLGVCFLVLTVRPDAVQGRTEVAHHLLMTLAMVWMVAAMPLLMGPMDGERGMPDMGAMPGMATPGPASGWASAVGVVLVVGLGLATLFWITRVARPRSAAHESARGAGTLLVLAPTRRSLLADPRAGALCHVLAGAGMAAMLAAMQ